MMKSFPEIIKNLPEADIPIEGVKAYISQADSHQILFMELQNDIAHKTRADKGCIQFEIHENIG